ncbi:6498_t:CDS:2 [Cetraspora pellucida]|uniref:6498_t:CDS:1 n=1 Tax=Cetraspora pellucida TaxID=1433469 RepID=A0A9N9HKQ9_9GLOM|nr:6498_t:CDS:2 [Cetraspora pellucida]
MLDSILDVFDGTGQAWKVVNDDTEEESGGEKNKNLSFFTKKTNEWTEKWNCHCYEVYKSVAKKDANKKPFNPKKIQKMWI